MSRDLNGVSLLGNQNTKYLTEYDPSVLEKFKNQHTGSDDVVSLDCFEFSSLCLAGDTMIDVATDETRNTDGIPIKDLVGTEGYVFGVNPDTLEPVCRKYFDVRKTQENAPVVRVVLEKMVEDQNGITSKMVSLVCTPDHLILVKRGFRDSEWVTAKDLQPDMRLIATQHYDDVMHGKTCHRLTGEAVVVKVVDAGTQDVYNMEVEDVHNFFANGVVVHNCPKTGQPDLATIYISYIPDETLVESKSLKLYLFSFRNHGDFHEDCVKTICDDLVELLSPKYLEVYGDFNSRGGVSILPFSSYANDDYLRFQQARKLDVMSKHIGHKPRTS